MNKIEQLQKILEKHVIEKEDLMDTKKFVQSHCIIYTIISVLLLAIPNIFTFEFLLDFVFQILSLISLTYLGISIYQFAEVNEKINKCNNNIEKFSNKIKNIKENSNDLNMSKDVIKDKINSLNNLKETIIINNEKEDLSKIKILKK